MKILGIESSCDETAAAILEFTEKGECKILSNVIYSQIKEHSSYGGVIPEIASRMHLEKIDLVVKKSFKDAHLDIKNIKKIAVTSGPGLFGGLIVGTTYAQALSTSKNIEIIGINHLEGHGLLSQFSKKLKIPYTLLLASGGHCQFINVCSKNKNNTKRNKLKKMSETYFEELGGTLDDAIGECFDKVAKMLNLPYPGGREIEALAKKNGDPHAYKLPTPMKDGSLNFSFSGLKSAVRRLIDDIGDEMDAQIMANICASFQETVADLLVYKCRKAIETTGNKSFVLSGGVAANKLLRARLKTVCESLGVTFYAPPVELCTDNAVMIAYAGGLRFLNEQYKSAKPGDIKIRPRWPLSEVE